MAPETPPPLSLALNNPELAPAEMPVPRFKQPLRRGYPRRKAIRLLAEGLHTQEEVAKIIGVSAPAISAFVHMHQKEIDDLRAQYEESLAGIWIAQKEARVAEYEGMYEELSEGIDASTPEVIRQRRGLLKDVAEELGQLPKTNITIDNRKVVFEMNLGNKDVEEDDVDTVIPGVFDLVDEGSLGDQDPE